MTDAEKVVHVVDDDDSVRRSVGFMLKTSGYRVRSFASGAEILKESKALEPGCILLDIRMPGMDGLEVQEALRSHGVPLPVIIMTGHGDVPLSVRAMKAGAIDFIEKPFEKDVLITAIESGFAVLKRADSGREKAKDAAVRLQVLTPREAFFAEREAVPWGEAAGRVCAEVVAPYPPGVPLLAPGERITGAVLDALQRARDEGARVAYAADPTLRSVQVVRG